MRKFKNSYGWIFKKQKKIIWLGISPKSQKLAKVVVMIFFSMFTFNLSKYIPLDFNYKQQKYLLIGLKYNQNLNTYTLRSEI